MVRATASKWIALKGALRHITDKCSKENKVRLCGLSGLLLLALCRVTYIFVSARHTAGDFSLVSFLLVRQKKRKEYLL